MARGAAPQVGVRRRHHDPVGIGPVVVEALPDAVRALRDVRVVRALAVHLQIPVGAVAEQFPATGPEIGQTGQELLRCRGRLLVQMDRRHGVFLDSRVIRPGPRDRGSDLSRTPRSRTPRKSRRRSAHLRVPVAPPPRLTRFVGTHDRVSRLREMRGRVPMRARIAASDMPTGETHPQVRPVLFAERRTLLAATGRPRRRVRAGGLRKLHARRAGGRIRGSGPDRVRRTSECSLHHLPSCMLQGAISTPETSDGEPP